jgi:hypothetical protein
MRDAMKEFDVADMSRDIARLVARTGGAPVDQDALSDRLREVLFGSRGLWQAFKSELVTLDEAAEAATAHLETWFEETGTVPADEVHRVSGAVLALLRETLEQTS